MRLRSTRNTGARGPFFNDDIAFVQRQHAFEQFGRWLVTDGDESAVGCHMGFFASDGVSQINAEQPLGITSADETFHRLVPEHLRPEARREAKACVSTRRSRWSRDQYK